MQEQIPGKSRCNQISSAILQTGWETISTLSTSPNLGLSLPSLLPAHKRVALLTCRAQGAVQKVWHKTGQVKNQRLVEFKSRLGNSVKERKLSVACYTLKGNLLISIIAKSDTLQNYSQKQVLHIAQHTPHSWCFQTSSIAQFYSWNALTLCQPSIKTAANIYHCNNDWPQWT